MELLSFPTGAVSSLIVNAREWPRTLAYPMWFRLHPYCNVIPGSVSAAPVLSQITVPNEQSDVPTPVPPIPSPDANANP
jgi:hypothetical protein